MTVTSGVFAPTAMAGRTVFVTGASSGIGRVVATAIATCGGRVIANGRDEGRLNETLAALPGEGHAVVVGAIENADQTAELVVGAAEAAGGLDGVFHSAGVELLQPTRLLKQKHIDAVITASLMGAFGIARAACKAEVMKPNSAIVFMSSVSAGRGVPGMAAYSATKAGVEGLTRSLASELASKSVRVNALAAGGVETEMHDRFFRNLSPEAVAAFIAQHPLGLGQPQNLADAALFLLSPAAAWITGVTLVADGGFLVKSNG